MDDPSLPQESMHATDVQKYARQMMERSGPSAIAEAAQRAAQYEKEGDKEHADTWRRIEAAMMLMHGPRVS